MVTAALDIRSAVSESRMISRNVETDQPWSHMGQQLRPSNAMDQRIKLMTLDSVRARIAAVPVSNEYIDEMTVDYIRQCFIHPREVWLGFPSTAGIYMQDYFDGVSSMPELDGKPLDYIRGYFGSERLNIHELEKQDDDYLREYFAAFNAGYGPNGKGPYTLANDDEDSDDDSGDDDSDDEDEDDDAYLPNRWDDRGKSEFSFAQLEYRDGQTIFASPVSWPRPPAPSREQPSSEWPSDSLTTWPKRCTEYYFELPSSSGPFEYLDDWFYGVKGRDAVERLDTPRVVEEFEDGYDIASLEL
ncbi:hypothetical protein DL98DRAFT_585190 [Cadophora sp. DSE1049]|nr:hypothetical protein DL98DRAFT_585190 [Cadophora sp. DSE1049]